MGWDTSAWERHGLRKGGYKSSTHNDEQEKEYKLTVLHLFQWKNKRPSVETSKVQVQKGNCFFMQWAAELWNFLPKNIAVAKSLQGSCEVWMSTGRLLHCRWLSREVTWNSRNPLRWNQLESEKILESHSPVLSTLFPKYLLMTCAGDRLWIYIDKWTEPVFPFLCFNFINFRELFVVL